MGNLKLISNLIEFMAEPLAFMRDLAEAGELQSLRIGPKRFVFIFGPEAAQEVLTKRCELYVQNRTVFDRIQPVTGKKGLVQLAGHESRSARAKARTMFTPPTLNLIQEIVESYCDELVTTLASRPEFDVAEEMTHLILQTALRIFLGIESPALAAQIGKRFLRLNELCGLRMRSLAPVPLFMPTGKNREIRSLQREIRRLIEKELNSGSEGGVSKAFRGDPALIDHCMTFLFAGHETTAASLAFTFLLLARNPRYQDKIAYGDEAMSTAVYKESLRLFPPAYMLAREAVGEDELFGTQIHKGDQVIIGVSELHRNPRTFERPDEFIPERFLSPARNLFAFIPFGAGGKSCIGERLAYFEAGIVLRRICRAYRLSAGDEPIEAEPLITLHPLPNQKIRLQGREENSHVSI